MKWTALSCLVIMLLMGCSKEHSTKVDIYLLKSFTAGVDTTGTPGINVITNAVLDATPLVADKDIRFYTRESSTFTLRKDIQTTIKNYSRDKAFAVTVDGQVIYYGVFQPAYLSSVVIGLPTIRPMLYKNNELRIDFLNFGGTFINPLDKRNDARILDAFKASGRLR